MQNYNRLKWACYSTNVAMAVVVTLSPILFLTFREMYHISYSLLGLLVLINFCTQLFVDLIFSFFSHKFNIPRVVKLIPPLTIIGLFIYALSPVIFTGSYVFIGLCAGTIVFASSCGLSEVLISPIIAAIPSDDPDREMSKLHSTYAWGVVGVVIFATLFLYVFGNDKWQLLTFIFCLIPLFSSFLYYGTAIPEMKTPEKASNALGMLKSGSVWLCVAAIFLGGASECTMSQWCSGYLEGALELPKIWGDLFGVALFGLALGVGRTLYSKIGKNIEKVLILGAIGATACYIITALTGIALLGLFTCAFTGFCTSMLWPGSLIIASDRHPDAGVFIFALMAAGGDLGASVGPQLAGIVTDAVMDTDLALTLAERYALTTEQVGLKAGMLLSAIFPLAAIFIYIALAKKKKNQ